MRYWGIFTHKDKLKVERDCNGWDYPMVWCKKDDALFFSNKEKESVNEVEIIKKHKKGGSK